MRRYLLVLSLFLIPCSGVFAGARHFGFLYEATTSAPGSFESENTITWKRTTDPGHVEELEFRHEIEIGVTEHFQASIYFADWGYSHEPNDSSVDYSDAALELIYNFTNPVLDPVGLSFYQELRLGSELIEWESKLIAQKNFGPLILLYNATLEAVWEGKDREEHEGEFTQSVGASYELSKRWSVGVELVHEFVLPDWKDDEKIRNVFVGPNVSYRHGNWFTTVSVLAQATDTPDEADFQVRAIFGIGL